MIIHQLTRNTRIYEINKNVEISQDDRGVTQSPIPTMSTVKRPAPKSCIRLDPTSFGFLRTYGVPYFLEKSESITKALKTFLKCEFPFCMISIMKVCMGNKIMAH